MKRKCSACLGFAVGIGFLALVAGGFAVFKALRSRRKAVEKPAVAQAAEVPVPAPPPAVESAAANPLVS